jgi:nucleoside-diphosphate-sugar epimerase
MSKLENNPSQLIALGDGTQERDFAYVTDVVEAMVLAATVAPGQGEVYNVASGRSCTIAELARIVSDVRNVNADIEFTGSIRPGDADKWVVDITRLEKIGFKNQVSLEQGIHRISQWYDGLQHNARSSSCE